jgi:hypothetical protein
MKDLADLIGTLLAAGGPPIFSPRRTWALHRELRELSQALNREGLSLGELSVTFAPDPDVGIRVIGADEAVWTLVGQCVLRPEGMGREARLRVNQERLGTFQRQLMRLRPAAAAAVYRAARRWAAAVETASKKAETPAASSGETVASSTPKRLAVVADGSC